MYESSSVKNIQIHMMFHQSGKHIYTHWVKIKFRVKIKFTGSKLNIKLFLKMFSVNK